VIVKIATSLIILLFSPTIPCLLVRYNNGINAVTSLLTNNVGNFLLNYCENMITAEFILDVRIDVNFILDDIEGNWCRGTNSGWLEE